MNPRTGSVSARILKHAKFYGFGALGLAAAVVIASGITRVPLFAASGPEAMVSNMRPFSASTIAPLVALDRATEAVTSRILPAVVNIQIVGKSKPQAMEGGPGNIPAPFRQFFQFQQQAPRSQVFMAEGAGVIISPDGYIVTNNHVVHGATQVQVTLNDKRQFHAKVVGTDPATDLAVVKIDATGLTSAAFGDSARLQPGQTVLAIGDPMGMDFSVTRGIVSAVNRARTASDGPDSRGSFIQTDAPINHGNSGGPLVDSEGQVVGINTEMLSTSGASAGIGFAIPSDLVKSVATSLIKNGKVLRGYLGIQVTDLAPNVASSLNEPNTQGALVNQVNADSPAETAGIKPYDVVTRFNGHTIASGTDLQTLAGGTPPGAVAHLEVLRNGKPMSFAVTLGNFDAENNPTAAAAASSGSAGTPKLGITVEPLTPDLRGQLQLPSAVHGVVVDSVSTGGPAMLAGVARGDVIEQVNQHPVTTVAELQRQLALTPAGKDVLLLDHKSNGDFILPVHP
ncbi:MAG TPA: Do family serine endopeptidase [Terriglobales bacterium]|nr:Do family serine endopeptidase [Terriglobales bacterium]